MAEAGVLRPLLDLVIVAFNLFRGRYIVQGSCLGLLIEMRFPIEVPFEL